MVCFSLVFYWLWLTCCWVWLFGFRLVLIWLLGFGIGWLICLIDLDLLFGFVWALDWLVCCGLVGLVDALMSDVV